MRSAIDSAGRIVIPKALRDRLGLELTRPQLVKLHEACGGNPLFALEIGRELQEGRIRLQPGAPVPVTESLLGLVERRTRRLPGSTQRVLGAAAAHPHGVVAPG